MTSKKSSKKPTTGSSEKHTAKRKKAVPPVHEDAGAKAVEGTATLGQSGGPVAKPARASASPKEPASTQRGGKGAKRSSGLDAAAQVLAEAGEPLNCRQVVERMLAKGLWKTGGKTPAATIYSALLRHIQKNGSKSRFRKTERGKFDLAR